MMNGRVYRRWSAFIHRYNYHHMKTRYPLDPNTGHVVADAHCDWCGMTADLPRTQEQNIAWIKARLRMASK